MGWWDFFFFFFSLVCRQILWLVGIKNMAIVSFVMLWLGMYSR